MKAPRLCRIPGIRDCEPGFILRTFKKVATPPAGA